MIEVQPKDIVDVLLNIPNAIYTFYFHTKVCNIKNKKAYIIILTPVSYTHLTLPTNSLV